MFPVEGKVPAPLSRGELMALLVAADQLQQELSRAVMVSTDGAHARLIAMARTHIENGCLWLKEATRTAEGQGNENPQ